MQPRIEGDEYFTGASAEDVKSILSANGYEFGGANIKIELLASTEADLFRRSPETTLAPSELSAKFKEVITRRYREAEQLLDLSAICEDPELKAIGLTSLTSRSKFFPALMKICDDVFPSKETSVISVLLDNNSLQDVAPVTTLAFTFPAIKNLSLANNKLSSMKSIVRWQHKFKQLEHIVLTNNPLEQEVPDFKAQLLRWYPKLHSVDGASLPAAELEAARAKKTPPKARPGRFHDPDGVAGQFLTNFFNGYDSDRKGLASYYYDDKSRFSMNVNTKAMSAPSQKMQQGEWDSYIRLSRNLVKITHPGPRMKRSHEGTQAITEIFTQLPATRHPGPDEQQKWCIECELLPGLPDPTGQTPGGVNGLLVTVHGEFEEVQTKKLRSFDRTFTLGPNGAGGVRVVNDMLTIRAYGGTKAYESTTIDPAAEETAQKEMMVLEIMKRTGMNAQYSAMCLAEAGFDFEKALVAFEQAKANIPPEAYIQ
jgi:nuclear RNA export factor